MELKMSSPNGMMKDTFDFAYSTKFDNNSFFYFMFETYLEVKKSSQTSIQVCLQKKLKKSGPLLNPFSFYHFLSEAYEIYDYSAVTGGTARYLM